MKKALMFASVASMIEQFNMENIKLLQSLGYKVDVACNFQFGSTITQEKIEKLKQELKNLSVVYHNIPIPRKISNIKDLNKSYKITKKLMNKENYDLIHCHSPIGGVICRFANKNSNNYKNSKLIYTAHGFHFFKGNKVINNFIYKNIEKYMANFTDILITINREDYSAAQKFKLRKNGTVKYVPGVGININNIGLVSKNRKKVLNELNIKDDSFLLLSVGELNDNKNHSIVINCMPFLKEDIHYLICGIGALEKEYIELSKKLGVENRVHLLGYRSDVLKIMKSCDIFVFPSKREGLGLAALEAMACGLPLITSNRHGILDYSEDHVNSIICDPFDQKQFEEAINFLYENSDIRKKYGEINIMKSKKYDISEVNKIMKSIYMDVLSL